MASRAREITMPMLAEPLVEPGDPGDSIALVTTEGDWIATLTFAASTVRLIGPERIFAEPTAAYAVRHDTWVRTLPEPFTGSIDRAWFDNALEANRSGLPDILAISMQYLRDVPPIYDGHLQIAGEAAYGPLNTQGERQEQSDFNDYLGVTWSYAEGRLDGPETDELRCLDCSGFMRMIWGYRQNMAGLGRASIPLCYQPSGDHAALPRRSYQIYASGPGVIVIQNKNARVSDLSPLAIGDLVFFDRDQTDGRRLDHVGMYLGPDEGGHHRFISSRKTHNGPTLGDVGGRSILDGTRDYARSFRAARRL
jgi:cell wall-associated NlpC family hydrolase